MSQLTINSVLADVVADSDLVIIIKDGEAAVLRSMVGGLVLQAPGFEAEIEYDDDPLCSSVKSVRVTPEPPELDIISIEPTGEATSPTA